jgi:hypothetical protein
MLCLPWVRDAADQLQRNHFWFYECTSTTDVDIKMTGKNIFAHALFENLLLRHVSGIVGRSAKVAENICLSCAHACADVRFDIISAFWVKFTSLIKCSDLVVNFGIFR